jgi:hypothetical protein
MLTPSERELLLLKQSEMRFVALSRRIIDEAQLAYRAWTHWIAIRDQSVDDFRQVKVALQADGIDLEIGLVQRATARDAMLRAYQLSDPVGRTFDVSQASLCRLALELENTALLSRLTSQAWALERGARGQNTEAAAKRNTELVAELTSQIVPDWTEREPAVHDLKQLRDLHRGLRDEMVHGVDPGILFPTVNQVGRFMKLTLRLASHAHVVATGDAFDAEEFERVQSERAQKFWKLAFAEPIRLWTHDTSLRERTGG